MGLTLRSGGLCSLPCVTLKPKTSHSPATAVRRILSELDQRRHRLGKKSAPPAEKLACGLLGTGQFFNYAYLPALNRKDSPLVLSGVLARDENKFRAAQRGLRYTTKYFADSGDLLASGVNSVLILLPNHLHYEFTRRALERGRNVYCEKPLAQNVADCLALKKIAAQSGRVLMVDFNQRFSDRNRVLKNVIAENRIGKIISVHAFHNQDLRGLKSLAPLHRDLTGGGVVHNAGVHFVNLFLHWFGDLDRVHAVFENRALPAECGEDTARCEFWFRNGVTATLAASLANAVETSYERVEFIGTEGEIASDLKRSEITGRDRQKQQLKINCKREIMSDTVFSALEHFEHCARNHLQPETDVDDAIKTMKVIEALTLSAQRGAAVELGEIERKYGH
jgi:predicted dehydrogenase